MRSQGGRSVWLRPEAMLLGLLLLKLTLSGLWLAAGPTNAGPDQAVAAEAKPAATTKQNYGSDAKLLDRQREELRRREERLRRREAEVEALATEVEARLDELAALQAKLKEQVAGLSGEKNKVRAKQIKHLVEVYSSMKAEKAAALIDKLDEGVVVEIFALMPSENAGKVLSFVDPEKAARISQRLAERP